MTLELKPGTRLRSALCTVEVVVVKAPAAGVDVRCGNAPMLSGEERPDLTVDPPTGFDGGSQMGKRYADESGELELLCTKAGPSSLSLGDVLLQVKSAKPLPASD